MNRRNDVQAGLVTRLIPVLVLVMGGSAGGRMSLVRGGRIPSLQHGASRVWAAPCACSVPAWPHCKALWVKEGRSGLKLA